MTPRTGRPPVENPRRNQVHIRFSDDEQAAIEAAASKAGLPLGVWMRQRLLAAAKRTR